MITLASWDTEHFDIKVGNLTLEAPVTEVALHQAVAQATTEGYDLLYLKDVTLEQEWLNDRWLLADEKVVYKSFRPFPIPHQRCIACCIMS